jgi:hypothetical protein
MLMVMSVPLALDLGPQLVEIGIEGAFGQKGFIHLPQHHQFLTPFQGFMAQRGMPDAHHHGSDDDICLHGHLVNGFRYRFAVRLERRDYGEKRHRIHLEYLRRQQLAQVGGVKITQDENLLPLLHLCQVDDGLGSLPHHHLFQHFFHRCEPP